MSVSVISGSESDDHIVKLVTNKLNELGVKYSARVLSAHRNPRELAEYMDYADSDVFIAIAGMAAHLAGAIKARTKKPVIAVPVAAASGILGGLDSLLSCVQMPPGTPVATVGVNAGQNAAILAAEILALRK